MECYIKCPPDKNVSLTEGEASVNFEVERPKTNYDWDRFRRKYIIFEFNEICSTSNSILRNEHTAGSVH